MANTKVTKILMRNGKQSDWDLYDTIASLEVGEIGFESDTYRLKIGNNENDTVGTLYKDLDYFAAGIVSIQEVDAAHENGLMIDLDGKLELDIGQLVGRVDQYDSIIADLEDSVSDISISIDSINIELDRLEEDHQDSIDKLIDSIQQASDSITLNLDVSVNANTDSIEDIIDSIGDIEDFIEELDDTKVSKSGDTMTGSLIFETPGYIGTPNVDNFILTNASTFVDNLLEPRKGVRIGGTIIETNDSYFAVSEEDIVDIKSLKQNRRRVVVSQKTVTDGGGLIYKENNDVITYRQSIKLQPIAEELLDSVEAATDTVAIIDILDRFFRYIEGVVTVPLAAPYDIVDEDML